MVARKLSSFDSAAALENLCKQRPSIYIDPESDIFEGLHYLQQINTNKCVNCIQLWRKSSKVSEGNGQERYLCEANYK
jgi:hypothetical protein